MKPLEFNTLNNLNDYDPVKDLASQTRSGIKSMQVDVADVGIPSHVVLPVFERDRAGDYVVAVDGHPTGPYTVARLNEMMREGIITTESYVWRSGMSDWLRIKDCPDIIK